LRVPEQRIGRVDRIGQRHVVRAINFVLEDTVEHRVRQVLETKLEVIAQEFGVDKASDVMDSADAEPIFDELFLQGLQDPASIEKACDAVIDQVRDKVADERKNSELLTDAHTLDADAARKWRDHPAQFWLERAITTGLPARGGSALKSGDSWRVKWTDGFKRKRFLPVFATDDGRTFIPTAKRIWDLLLTESIEIKGTTTAEQAASWFDTSLAAAKNQGERMFAEMLGEHRMGLKEDRERALYAFEARSKAIGRIGLPAVREHRRKRLNAEHQMRLAALDEAQASVPDLNAVMMLRVGGL